MGEIYILYQDLQPDWGTFLEILYRLNNINSAKRPALPSSVRVSGKTIAANHLHCAHRPDEEV